MNTVEKVLLLQDIEFQTGAPTESLARLAMAANDEEAHAGTILFEIGQRSEELLFLISGRVTLTNQDGCSCMVE